MSPKQKKELGRITLSAAFFLSGILTSALLTSAFGQILSLIFIAIAYLTAGLGVLKSALEGILHGQIFDENFLMAIATVGALIIGEYHEAAAVMLFYQLGEWFEHYAVGKSRASISELMDICPETATVERSGQTETCAPEEVIPGEIIVVRPGERIPLDGIIIEGTSALDTSALTGESLPRDVSANDEVISGCVNQFGLLRVRVTKPYADSTVARILELVENASDRKARAESFITRFARIYTPAVCAMALLLFLLPPLFTDGDWATWGYRALSFLVVSCPCALVISVPLSFFGGIGCASRCGILIKGSNYLEALAKAKIAVFDKTGTLTQGQFHVTEIKAINTTEETLISTASIVESHSNHPISRSICAAFPYSFSADDCRHIQEIPGQGVVLNFQGDRLAAGNEKLMKALACTCPDLDTNGTVVHVAKNNTYLGYIIVADQPKSSSAEAIAYLKAEGITKTVMLTGDQENVARSIATQLGVDEVYAQLLPDEKLDHIEMLLSQKKEQETLFFVGDGINDAPVLTRADIGIAMGALGSAAAVEAADIVLMDDDPCKVALALRIGRRTLNIVRQNIFFAIGVKLLVLLLVAAGAAGMWLAVFADVGVSVIAILNAMRALKIKSK